MHESRLPGEYTTRLAGRQRGSSAADTEIRADSSPGLILTAFWRKAAKVLQRRRQADGELRSTTGELEEGGSVGPAEKKCGASGIENRKSRSPWQPVGWIFFFLLPLQVDASPHGLTVLAQVQSFRASEVVFQPSWWLFSIFFGSFCFGFVGLCLCLF